MADQTLTTIRCKECSHAVSRRDRKCPLCGSPIERSVETRGLPPQWLWALGGSVVIVIVIVIVVIFLLAWRPNPGTNTRTAEPSPQSRSDSATAARAPQEIGANNAGQETSPPARHDTLGGTPESGSKQPSRTATVAEAPADSKPGGAELPKAAVDAFRLGRMHLAKGDYDLAIADFNEAVRLNPNYPEAFTNRGFVYLYKADYDRAIRDFGEAIRLRPSSDLFANRGLAYFNKRDYERAIQDYGEAIGLSPNDAELFNDRGAVYAGKGDYERAIQDYGQALRLNPNYPAALNNRGWAYSQKGERERAIADYLAALKLKPEDPLRKHIEAALKALGVSAR
jgi:Flp pilus assembly protein TadD